MVRRESYKYIVVVVEDHERPVMILVQTGIHPASSEKEKEKVNQLKALPQVLQGFLHFNYVLSGLVLGGFLLVEMSFFLTVLATLYLSDF